jgi:PAS domain S-box-containing protein
MTEESPNTASDDSAVELGEADPNALVHLLLESTGEGMYGIDMEGLCTFANPACVRLLGFDSVDELLGKNMHDLIHHTRSNGEPYPMTECKIYRAFREGNGVHVDDEVMFRRDGEQFCAEYWSYPMRRDDELVGSVLTFVDITTRREEEQQFRESQALTSLLLESTGEGMYGIDMEGLCTFANPACVRLLGFDSVDELLGKNMHDLIHHTRSNGEPYPMTECKIYRAFREGNGVHVDDEVMFRRDGEQFCAEYWSYPMRRDDELVGSVLTFVDITTRREEEEQLHQAKALAEEASAAKSQFMANMSHELRTPMNAILGYSEMLMEDAEDDGLSAMVEDLKKINAAGKHLLDLINSVLDLSKIEAGRMDVHVEQFGLAELLDEVAAVAEPLIAKNNNTFVKKWDESLGTIDSDITKVRQALFNLLSNAAKFTSNGRVSLTVQRHGIGDDETVTFVLSDTGVGIPADKFEHIFEEFAQAEETTTRDYGGTGLGLSLTRRLSRLLGGDVTLQSEVGVGSVFTLELPTRSGEPAAARARADHPVTADHGTNGGWHVLVIDDDAHTRDLLTRTLEGAGYGVVTASGGSRGLELAKKLKPALITLDILLPDKDGWTVLSELKADPDTMNVPVVMLSIAPNKDRGYMMGAVESLTKPVDRKLLHDVVSRYLSAGQTRVLIVDDDLDSRSLLARYVEAEGWSFTEAVNGKEALQLLDDTENVPDLILLDLMMPVMDGFQFVEQVQSRAKFRHVPIVVVTSKTVTAEDHDRLRGSVERVIEKGQSTTEELLQYIREMRPSTAGDETNADVTE